MDGLENIGLRRPQTALAAEVVRELTAEDIVIRGTLGAESGGTPTLKKLRATHHKLAQLIALGVHETEAALATGYCISRVSILKGDPAFRELLAFYSGEREKIYVDVQQRMAGFAVDALDVLQDRLEEKPDSFSVKDLNNLIKTTADRGGYSPVQRSENKTIVLNGDDLAKIKSEVQANQNGQVRKINQAEEALRVHAKIEDDSRLEVCAQDNRPPSAVSEETKAPGLESSGGDV